MLPLDDEGVAYALVALRKIQINIEKTNLWIIFLLFSPIWLINIEGSGHYVTITDCLDPDVSIRTYLHKRSG